jgi:tight adherence protein B
MSFVTLLAQVLIFLSVTAIVFWGGQLALAWYADYEGQAVERTEKDLYGMFLNLPPQRIVQISLLCFVLGFLLGLVLFGYFTSPLATFLSLAASAMLGLFTSFIPKLVLKRLSILRLRRFDLQLLDALLSMSNALKAGFSITQSFEAIVEEGRDPISQEFDLLLREVRLGVKFEDASENLSKRIPSEDLHIVLTGIETARQTGGNLTEVFDRLATVIRERMRVQGRIQSLTAQGRLQGWVVGLLPFALGIAFYFKQPSMMISFIQAPAGMACIAFMLLMEGLGVLLIRKIVNIDV